MSKRDPAEPGLLTAEQVAARLAVSPDTVWRLARSGRLPRVDVTGRLYRFDPAVVEAYIAAGRRAPMPTTTPRTRRGRGGSRRV